MTTQDDGATTSGSTDVTANEDGDCATGGAVPDAANNSGLVSDCNALLKTRDTLAGDATLNWSASTPIATWDGVTLGGTPQRVTQLNLQNKGLTGKISTQLRRLTELTALNLADNQLTGCLPTGLQDVAINDLAELNLPGCAQFDFDGNGEVDLADSLLLFFAFFSGSSDPRFDLDGNGEVDSADLDLFRDVFDSTGQAKLVAMAQDQIGLPDAPQLQQNAPNPFNSQTVLSYFLPEPGPARMEILTLTGQRVAVLHQGQQRAGYHRLSWNGRNDAGRLLASGVYLYRLVTTKGVLTRKLVLLR
ncbi:MAG: T9SS type A sorting domain-containing protein [Gemmatimonadota bacterium]|nr:T9SS type A sorting domain-containing protein [Gemmatimonadota bacterium]